MELRKTEEIITRKNHIFLMLFRVVLVLLVTFGALGKGSLTDGITSKELIIIFASAGYLLGALLLGINRAAIYLEVLLIVFASYFVGENFMALFVFPTLVAILFPRPSSFEFLFVPLMISAVVFYNFGFSTFGIIISISLFLLMFLKDRESKIRNEETKILKIESHKLRKDLNELEREKIQIEIDMENLMNMFIRMKNLNEKIKLDDLLHEMIQGSVDFFHADQVALYFLDGENYVLGKVYDKKISVPKEIDAIDGEEIIINNKYIRLPIDKNNEKWCLLLINGKKQALISDKENGVRYVPTKFDEDDYEQLKMFLQQVMNSVNYAELLSRMENMANRDYLTGIANRRRFVEEADNLIERAKRGADLAMILLDIDHFKKFNDTYGHDKGDEALKVVSNVLDEFVRGSDFVGRLGGEEFGILMPNNNEAVASAADRLREKISEVPFVKQITVSMGVAFYEDGMTFDELNKKSDEALYRAKETGRNKVVVYDEMD